MWVEKACFSKKKKMFTNGLIIGLPLEASVEKLVYGVETYWLSGKEKLLGAAISKEGHVDNVLGKDLSLLIFLKKGAIIKSVSYYQLHRKNSPYLLNDPCTFDSSVMN